MLANCSVRSKGSVCSKRARIGFLFRHYFFLKPEFMLKSKIVFFEIALFIGLSVASLDVNLLDVQMKQSSNKIMLYFSGNR